MLVASLSLKVPPMLDGSKLVRLVVGLREIDGMTDDSSVSVSYS